MQIPDIRDDITFLSEKKWKDGDIKEVKYEKYDISCRELITTKNFNIAYVKSGHPIIYSIYMKKRSYCVQEISIRLCLQRPFKPFHIHISKYVPQVTWKGFCELVDVEYVFISQSEAYSSKKCLHKTFDIKLSNYRRNFILMNLMLSIIILSVHLWVKNINIHDIVLFLYKIWKFKYIRIKDDDICITSNEHVRFLWKKEDGMIYENLPRIMQRKERFELLFQRGAYKVLLPRRE